MNKKEYWDAHVKRNPSFVDEDKQIQMSVKMLRCLMEEAYDKGFEQRKHLGDSLKDIFKNVGDLGGLNNYRK